jgi:hypothetical protein
MRHVAPIVVAAAILAAPHAAAKGPPTQVLGILGGGKALTVAKLDALTLKPLATAIPIRTEDLTFVGRSPGNGTRAVFGDHRSGLRFVDLRTMRWEFRLSYPGVPTASLWPSANRLVTLSSTAQVIVVDPTKRRPGAFRSLGGSLAAAATMSDRIVAVVAPLDGIGQAKLAVIGDTGRVRTAPLPQILAGSEMRDNGSSFRFEYPAFTVDDFGTRAVVISASGAIADVRLDTLAMSTHVLASRTLASVRKNANGSNRLARWIGTNTIALTGNDVSFDGTSERDAPAGLSLIDTRDWNARRIDATTNAIAYADGALLAFGRSGVEGYDSTGNLRFHLFDGTQVRPSCIAGPYAYFGTGTHFTIVDTWTGNVVKTADTAVPTRLTAY